MSADNQKKQGFTLLELIIAIIIIAVLATLAYTQYTTVMEKQRLSEVIANISVMRELAHEYYLKNGTLTGLSGPDVGIGSSYPSTCDANFYFMYHVEGASGTSVELGGDRCTGSGKKPYWSRQYNYHILYNARSGYTVWHCFYRSDMSSCYGLPP